MIYNTITLALAMSATASAATLKSRQSWDPCQNDYSACIEAGTPQVACFCTLAVCVGQDNARTREYCASATASLNLPTPTSIPGGCNPAHPGSCPSSYFQTSTASPPAFTPIPGIPGGCNPAHPGSCPSSYFQTTTASPPAFTPIPGIPGGCNPAHPGSCPSSYFQTSTKPAAATPTDDCDEETPSAPAPAPAAPVVPAGSNPVLVPGKTWTIANLTRYCSADNTGCEYNFAIEANGKTERCTVVRQPGANAATESWSNQPCTAGSSTTVSWGYVTEPAPPFAVITVNQGKELAWFGVSNVNGGRVTDGAPFGSGDFGTLPAGPVYTYN
ncbi:hypothetical protein J1614_002907 [Plenodomus biglobosus]|nr:hypothetical protein J1614_002907 [Plenodomus biglobosus]